MKNLENLKYQKISLLEVGHLVKKNEKNARLIFKSEKLPSNNQKVVFGRSDDGMI